MFDNIELKDAVRRAIQTEKNAMDFYQRGAEMMKNAEARKVFQLLAREEREHAEWFYNVYPGDDIADLDEFIKIEDISDDMYEYQHIPGVLIDRIRKPSHEFNPDLSIFENLMILPPFSVSA